MSDPHHMQLALAEARKAYGRTTPNPMVGCVIVRDGRVIGRGHHVRAGADHAEVMALKDAAARGEDVRGATMVVTLEPCAHFGRTPPCADACVAAGLGRVVVGMVDPFPRVAGGGIRKLEAAGIEVVVGVEEEACRRQNAPFLTAVTRGRPHVTAKVAMSLDGKIATRTGSSFPMTGEAARERVHVLRDRVDAILVGRVTAEVDDPRLTCRLPESLAGEGGAKDPIRVVLDSSLSLGLDRRIFHLQSEGASTAPTWLVVGEGVEGEAGHLAALDALGVVVIRCPRGADGRLDLAALMATLAQRDVQSVLVEGGGEVLASLLAADLIDVWVAHVAPVLIGGASAPSPLGGVGAALVGEGRRGRIFRVERLGEDVEIVMPVVGDVYGFD